MNCHDIAVDNVRRRPRLANEPPSRRLRAGQFPRQHLRRNNSPKRVVVDAKYNSHAAVAKNILDVKVADAADAIRLVRRLQRRQIKLAIGQLRPNRRLQVLGSAPGKSRPQLDRIDGRRRLVVDVEQMSSSPLQRQRARFAFADVISERQTVLQASGQVENLLFAGAVPGAHIRFHTSRYDRTTEVSSSRARPNTPSAEWIRGSPDAASLAL
jgi:hypothetical protein